MPGTPFHRVCLIIITSSLLLVGCTSLIAPRVKTEVAELKGGEYRIDPGHTSLLFKAQHLGLSTYVGRFNTVNATLDFDPSNLSLTRLNAVIDVSSIDVNNTELETTLIDGGWFDASNFPQATFETLSVEVLSDSTFLFTGALTLRGVTKPVKLNARFNGGAHNVLTGKYTIGFSATAVIKRSEFGIDKYIGLVADEVALEVFAEFLRE